MDTCRQLWESVADRDEATRSVIRSLIDKTIEVAEDAGDVAVIQAMNEDHDLGAEPIPWEQVKSELGL